jgi:hypothetical protein
VMTCNSDWMTCKELRRAENIPVKDRIYCYGTGISHSGMRNRIIESLSKANSCLDILCRSLQYVNGNDIDMAIEAMHKIREQIEDFERRAIYINDKRLYDELKAEQEALGG